MNSAFKRAQPLPLLRGGREFEDRLESDLTGDLPEDKADDAGLAGERGARIINLERVRFE